MPTASALSLASAVTLSLQFAIFSYLYSFHRARFFKYLLIAWGLMSLTKVLHLVRAFVPHHDVLSAGLNSTFFIATLLVLAGGLAFRTDYRIKRRDIAIGIVAGLAAACVGDLADASAAARSFVGFITGGTLIAAGLQFWPRRTQSLRYRGPRFLAVALVLWGMHRMVSPFMTSAPGTGPHVMMHAAFMVFYFLCTFAIIIVVLDRARSETATLKEFNERLVDGLGEGLQLVDGDYRIRHANRWMHAQLGPPMSACAKRPNRQELNVADTTPLAERRCYEVVGGDGAPCPGCPLGRRETMHEAERLEVSHADGRRFSLSCAPVRQPDGAVFLLELVTDVTERERLQARLTEAERLAAAGELAAGVAHEIRNPLAAIVNATTLLGVEETLTGEERAHTLGVVKKEARRLNRILSDFLIFARPREPKRLVSDVREVLDHVGALIREDPARAHHVELSIEVDPDVPPFVFDADQITQVVWNIALNGIEAMDGRGRLAIAAGVRDRHVAIAIRDTGRGMPAEEHRRVFEPFYSKKAAGTGLGLTIARRIVAAHGGRIEIDSAPGRGACFTVLLPHGD
jgi:two-component system sensor histidine kinase PilS (NtrC family)